MRRRAAAVAALLGVVVTALTGCDSVSPPGDSRVEVDTPKLRELKQEAAIEPCAPGDGGGPLPDLTLPCLGGGEDVDLASLTGPLVVNLWASWCGPCREEMPALQAFHTRYGDEVPLLGVDVEDTYPEAAIALARDLGATYPQLADPGGDLFGASELGLAQGLPQFLLVDADGEVQVVPGGLDSVRDVVELVERELGVQL